MYAIECPICLDGLKSPVVTPCGHLFCAECLDDYLLNDHLDGLAPCPACNTPFPTVDPDPRSIPAHLRPFVKPSIRRVYLPITDPENPRSEQNHQINDLEERIDMLYDENARLTEMKDKATKDSESWENAYRWMVRKYNGTKDQLNNAKETLRRARHWYERRQDIEDEIAWLSRRRREIQAASMISTPPSVSYMPSYQPYNPPSQALVPYYGYGSLYPPMPVVYAPPPAPMNVNPMASTQAEHPHIQY